MNSSPTKDLLERIDRLYSMLTSDLPNLHPSNTIHSMNPLPMNVKSESMIIDELQQYIEKMEREREILLRSYSILLGLFKHNELEIEHDDSELFPND